MRRMRWVGLLLVCSLLMTGASALPFGWGDVEPVVDAPENTVGGFVEAYRPSSFAWYFMGEATGETVLSLNGEHGELVLTVIDVEDVLLSDEGALGTSSLPDAALAAEASVRGATWASSDFPLAPIRGVGIGAERGAVIAAYPAQGSETLYTGELINPAYDDSWSVGLDFLGGRIVPMAPDASGYDEAIEYSFATLDEPDEWREYYVLTYYIADGAVAEIQLTYDCDPE